MLKYYSYSKKSRRFRLPRLRLLIPLFLIGIGLAALFYVLSPIIFFQLRYAPALNSYSFISPIPDVLATSFLNLSGVDYTRASNWFPSPPRDSKENKSVSSYFFSIPKLGIEEAVVSTVSDDLFKNLIHYSASPLPGEKGNAVILGHSTLPQFFNPQNYKTIFSTLHTIKIGDKMIVKIDGVTYKYSVFEIKIVEPQDISVLEQQYDDSYITVITCTPPGTYWKRLIVKGRVERLD